MSLSYRIPALLLTWSVFIVLAIGSKSYDPEEPIVREPVDYSVSIGNIGDVVLDNSDTTDTLSGVMLTGILNQAAGSTPTLRPGSLSFTTATEFNMNVLPSSAENTLRGNIQASVSEALTFNDNRTVQTGQLTVMFDGTTTLVTFPSDSNQVQIQTGTDTARLLSLDQLRERFSDEDQELNMRAASKAWATFENLWLTARVTETVQREIDEQLSMLTSIGLDQPLTIDCDNQDATPTPELSLRWDTNASGDGSDEAGNNDSFASAYRNCSFASDDRFLQGDLTMNSYLFRNTDAQARQMSFDAMISNLYIARENIESSIPAPSLTRLLVDGTLRVSVLEPATTP